MTLLSIALAAIIHVGVALTCIKVWPTERHAYRSRGPSAHEPNKSRVQSEPIRPAIKHGHHLPDIKYL